MDDFNPHELKREFVDKSFEECVDITIFSLFKTLKVDFGDADIEDTVQKCRIIAHRCKENRRDGSTERELMGYVKRSIYGTILKAVGREKQKVSRIEAPVQLDSSYYNMDDNTDFTEQFDDLTTEDLRALRKM